METDSIHLLGSQPLFLDPPFGAIANLNRFPTGVDETYLSESDFTNLIGYAFPVGKSLGMRIDASIFGRIAQLWESATSWNGVYSEIGSVGAVIEAGWNISPPISLGAGITVYPSYNRNLNEEEHIGLGPFEAWVQPQKLGIAGNLGFPLPKL
ncbi:MAG: hypothetical protein ACLFQW_04520 [Spirochaetaceae bacterium]